MREEDERHSAIGFEIVWRRTSELGGSAPSLRRYVKNDVDGALQTSLKVMFAGAGPQILDTGSKLSIRPEPSLLATIRA